MDGEMNEMLERLCASNERMAEAMVALAANCGDYRDWLFHEVTLRGVNPDQARRMRTADLDVLARDLNMQESMGSYYLMAPDRSPFLPKERAVRATGAQLARIRQVQVEKQTALRNATECCPVCAGTKTMPESGEACLVCVPEVQVQEKVRTETPVEDKALTLEAFRLLCIEFAREQGVDVHHKIIRSFGVTKLKDLKPEDYPLVIAKFEEQRNVSQ